ncbi:MAG: hypothetical protein GOV15_01445 [Candidatus Diapherotrites archaeon]|nr:hypothetical protein [Candidatus Diapherotrites archaeon]
MAALGVLSKVKDGKAHLFKLDFESDTLRDFWRFRNWVQIREQGVPTDLPAGLNADFVVLFNKKRIGVTSEPSEENSSVDGVQVIAHDDLGRNILKKRSVLSDLVVLDGFDAFFDFVAAGLQQGSFSSVSPNAVDSGVSRSDEVLLIIENFEGKMNASLTDASACLSEKKFEECWASLFSAVELISKAIAVGEDTSSGDLVELFSLVGSESEALVSKIVERNAVVKAQGTVTPGELTSQFTDVASVLDKATDWLAGKKKELKTTAE